MNGVVVVVVVVLWHVHDQDSPAYLIAFGIEINPCTMRSLGRSSDVRTSSPTDSANHSLHIPLFWEFVQLMDKVSKPNFLLTEACTSVGIYEWRRTKGL
jgi:hypothetical protein